MSNEQNKALVSKLFTEGMNKKNYAIFNEIIAPGFTNHGIPGAQQGPEGFRDVIAVFHSAFPDFTVRPEHIIAEGDLVATRGTATGTHNGEFMGVPASGRPVNISYVDFWRVENGKLVENWVQMDSVGIMQQIGATPEMA